MAGPMKLKVKETASGGFEIWLDEKKTESHREL